MTDYNQHQMYRSSGMSYQEPPGNWPQTSNHDHSYSSHYSHAAPSTRSWVQTNQAYPPLPPMEQAVEDSMSPAITPRPLPPHPTGMGMRPGTLYTVNADTIEEEEEPEYMHVDPNVSGQYEYPQPPPQQQHEHRYDYLPGPSSRRFTVESEEPIPVLASTPSPLAPAKKQRSFVGGFVKGIKRFPGKVLGYGVSKEKSRLFRRGTLGTEASGGGGPGRGNTLPEYRSNPASPLGTPGAVQYVQDMRMAFAPNHPIPDVIRSPPSEDTAIPPERNIPPSLMAGGALRRPVTPTLHVTPPSDDVSHDSHHESYQSQHHESYQSQEHHSYAIHQSQQPQYAQVVYPDPEVLPGNAERTTVMVYSDSNVDPHGMPMSDPGPQRMPSRTPRTSVVPPRQSTITIQTPIRSNPPPPPPMGAQAPLSQAPPSQDPQTILEQRDTIMSPATERLPPTADYRKMSNFPGSPSRGTTWTRTTATSWYDPSFASQHLTPVERFFKTLYHLPWVSHGRVTVDYRPGEGLQGKKKYKGAFKKPMSSWYRRFSRTGKSAELDLLSSGTMSIPNITQRTSFETSVMSSVQASPRSGRSGRRHTHGSDSRHHKSGQSSHRRHRHRHHHRRRRSLSTIGEPNDRLTSSPVIPPGYPYPYPAYPFPYPPYAAPPGVPLTPGFTGMPMTPPTALGVAQQGMPMQVIAAPVPIPAAQVPAGQRSSSRKPQRGPRAREASTRKPTYPNGYVPHQAMAYPPQMYYQGSPPTPGQLVGTPGAAPPQHQHHQQQPQQLIQYVPVPMQAVPGAFNPNAADYFQTASSIPSPPSSPTPRAGSAAPPAAP